MFETTSMAGTGMYAFIIVFALNYIGIPAEMGQVTQVIANLLQVASFVLWVWGQFTRTDLYLGIKRRLDPPAPFTN